jgi:hypothetical protein
VITYLPATFFKVFKKRVKTEFDLTLGISAKTSESAKRNPTMTNLFAMITSIFPPWD